MIARLFTLCMLVASLPFAAPALAAQESNSGIVEVVSPGGIRAWLRQDDSIPLLAIEFEFAGGGSIVPPEKAGTAVIASNMLSEGAGRWNGEEFRQVLADNAIGLGFQAGRDSLSGSLTTLTNNREIAVELLRAALSEPLMDETALRQQESRLITERRRSLTNPNALAYRNWLRIAYGEHPYAHSVRGTPESVVGIDQTDVDAFLARVLTRQGLTVGVAGDITPDELAKLLDEAFGALPDHAPPPDIPMTQAPPSGLAVVPHPGQQSVVTFGHEGISRDDPDWYAALVITQILGGSTFSSRLGEEVREKRGLAYGIGVGLSPSRAGSVLMGRTATRSDAVAETVALIRQEWRRLADEGPTAEELEDAKTYLIGSFPLSLDSTSAIASVLVQMQVFGLGLDYWQEREDLFQAVDMEQARTAAQRLLQPDDLLLVVVGTPVDVTPTISPPAPN